MSVQLRTRIVGTGSYRAEGVLTNFDLEKIVDTSDDWIVGRTGIRERRVAGAGICTSDMAAAALKNALEMAGKSANDLDMIVCGTVTPDRPLPATAAYVQQKIGATNHCASFDLAAACAGFIYGLSIADSFIRTGKAKTVGVIGVELLSRVLNYQDRNTCVLFGDGAGAVVVTGETGEPGVLSTHIFTDGSLTELLTIPAGGSQLPTSAETVAARQHYVSMEGKEVFRYAVRYLSSAAELALERNGLGPSDIDLVVAHQANMRILDGVSKRIKVPLDKFVLNIERYGNTSSASIPIALDEAVRAGRVHPGNTLLMVALGGGISWGSAVVRW
ncbi:MAG: ketoacyl-ACP synthase III [Proteobacteria bacterium]|jgi:3-oxoacyl-[acyl-carrier-protein] synthase-3|nr:ketoacyl-ACP synthase III [Pseudomonadota bacterium]